MPPVSHDPPVRNGPAAGPSALRVIPIEHVYRSPYRSIAPAPGLCALAAWLDNDDPGGVVLVRPRVPNGYELLLGEFAWRLAQAARHETLSARVLEHADDGLAQQLAALDAQQDAERFPDAAAPAGDLPWCGRAKMAMARAIRVLRTEQQWSLSAAAGLFGLSRAEGAHYVRVLTLPVPVLELVDQGALSFGQARALARIAPWPEHARLLAHKVAARPGTPARARRRPHSVREVERLVAATLRQLEGVDQDRGAEVRVPASRASAAVRPSRTASQDLARTERILTECCGFPVQIDFDPRSLRGRLILRFASLDEFQALAERLVPGIDFEDG